ncbi:MAG: hypothetical protein M3O46_16215 [Myxococcota bacterium]|nr:hypothetical protein [Myxococcota bacterium]
MSLSREKMLELMAFADGELDGEAKARVETLLAANHDARRVVDSLRGTVVRGWLADALEQRIHLADGIADAVMARIDESAVAAVSDPLPVIGLVARRSSGRLGQSSRLTVAAALLGSSLAVAAAVAISARSGERIQEPAPVASVQLPRVERGGPSQAPMVIADPEGASSARGVQVEEIDSTQRVSIFEISAMANASEPSSVVVWIDDDPGEK